MRHQEEGERESWKVLGGESGRVGASPRGQAVRIPGLMSVSLNPDVSVRSPHANTGIWVMRAF